MHAKWERLLYEVWSDPRGWQLLSQWLLILVGVWWLDFSLTIWQIALTLLSAVLTQTIMMRVFDIPRGYLSAIITAFGVSLLLRADNLWMHPLFTAIAIGCKFTLMVGEKGTWRPLFNPANLAVVMGSLMSGGWIVSGQWGRDSVLMILIVTLGIINALRARQLSSALGFLLGLLLALGVRVLWLGESWVIFEHHFQSGSLWIFAFFMITDPRTMPKNHYVKALCAAMIGIFHVVYTFTVWQPNGAIYILPCFSLLWWLSGEFSRHLPSRYRLSVSASDWFELSSKK